MEKILVKDHSNLYRDSSSRAIVNTDGNGYKEYVANREKIKSDKERISNLEVTVNEIKGDLTDIKNLLVQLADK